MNVISHLTVKIKDIPVESLLFEIHKEDSFSTVLKKYMIEQNISTSILSMRTGINKNTLNDYRRGTHIPSDFKFIILICIGLQISERKAEYLMSLANMALGEDFRGMVYRMIINLSFYAGITVDQGNVILAKYNLPCL